jgi:adenylate cyclase
MTFPGARRYTPREVYAKSGVDEETARSLWRAMGFPVVPEDEPAFTDADIEAVRLATMLFERADMDRTIVLQQARSMGQAAARIAASHQDVIAELVVDDDPTREAEEALSLAEEALPALDHLLVYMYRRHLAAATEQRLLITPSEEGGVDMSVGFADLSGFTAISQELDVRELAELIDRFNAATTDVVAQAGGRIIKTIGDEVMFASHEPGAAAEIALSLIDEASEANGLPPLKVGVATGAIIAREGDIFGPPVNLANRLVTTARPESALVDEATKEALSDDGRFQFTPLGKRTLKGIGAVHPFRLRSAGSASSRPAARRPAARRRSG